MGQRCYLETSFSHCLGGREVPWAWYIVGGTPGTTVTFGKRDSPYEGYQFVLESPIDAARHHVVERFRGIRKVLQELSSAPGAYDKREPHEASPPRSSDAWRALRRFFTLFPLNEYLAVLELLCTAPAQHRHVKLNASELMESGDDKGRGSHLRHWTQFMIANRLLNTAADLDFDAMRRIMLLEWRSDYLFPNDDFELPKHLAGWCRATFSWENTEPIAEYLLTDEELEQLNYSSFI